MPRGLRNGTVPAFCSRSFKPQGAVTTGVLPSIFQAYRVPLNLPSRFSRSRRAFVALNSGTTSPISP